MQGFSQKVQLRQHMMSIHEGKKPFSCNCCDGTFATKQQLKIHFEGVHEKKKPHKCEICDVFFGKKGHLNKHIKLVHEKKKPFQCHLCDTCFSGQPHTYFISTYRKKTFQMLLLWNSLYIKIWLECTYCKHSWREKTIQMQHL